MIELHLGQWLKMAIMKNKMIKNKREQMSVSVKL